MKRLWIATLAVFITTAFIACSNPIEPKDGSDDLALLNYGSFNEDGMKSLVKGAMADCMEDPACKAAMEKVDGSDVSLEEESSSSVAADTSSEEAGSSSSKKGPIIASSSSIKPVVTSAESSSNGAEGSSASIASSGSTVVSSSSKAISILNGACNATPTSIERGGSVTWKYVSLNSSLVIESYDWTFDEGSSVTTSKDATPSVTYDAKGSYGASVIINKGLDSEKTVKCTNPVTVTGIKVTGCTCSTTATSVVVSSSKPKDVTWTVSGCSGAEPFTYAWSGGASGTGASASMTISTVGSHAPKVTVTNSDGETMSPTCTAVSASEMPGAACYVGEHDYDANKTSLSVVPGQAFYFKPGNVTGVSGTLSMTLAGGGSSKTISVANGTNNSAMAMTAPAESGTYPYTLSVDGEEVCSASLTVAYASITTTCSFKSTVPGGTATFNVGSMNGWTDATGGSVTMVLSGNSTTQNLTIGRYSNGNFSVPAPTTVGNYEYTLTYQGNQACSATMKVEPITSSKCAIGKNVWNSGKDFFTPGDSFSSNWTGSSANMTLTLDGVEIVTDKAVANGYNGPQWQQVTLPTDPGTYVYTLTHMGHTVCEVEYEVAE